MALNDAIAVVELMGLPTAIAFADTAVKSANVKLLGYELSRGSGLVAVKLSGNVAAVNAAVDSGSITANQVGKVVAVAVFPRPSNEIEPLVFNSETVGWEEPKNVDEPLEPEVELETTPETEAKSQPKEIAVTSIKKLDKMVEVPREQISEEKEKPIADRKFTCNICKDPKCPRKFGEARKDCIHFKEQ